MALSKSDKEDVRMSTATATDLVRIMVQRESRGPGDTGNAMSRLEQRYGIGFWQLSHLRKGNAKTVDVGLFARIRAAYFDMCARQASALLHEIEMDAAAGNDDLDDLEAEARALVAKIQARKARKIA
jgi:hypothetical protein